MAVRDQDMHLAAALERARVRQIERHEQRIRENERAREQRRHACLVQADHEYRDHAGWPAPNHDVVQEGVAW